MADKYIVYLKGKMQSYKAARLESDDFEEKNHLATFEAAYEDALDKYKELKNKLEL